MTAPSYLHPLRAGLALSLSSLVSLPAIAGGTNGTTERVSFLADGTPISENCIDAVISANGRYVAFATFEPLFLADDNGQYDVYVQDLETGQLECASANSGGFFVDGAARRPAISADGRRVVYETSATIGVDNNGNTDVVWVDLDAGVPQLVSGVNAGFVTGNNASRKASLTADGYCVAFESAADNLGPLDTNGTWDIYVRDMSADTIERVSQGLFAESNGGSFEPSISANGNIVVFESIASNIVVFDLNGERDIFLHRRSTGGTELMTRSMAGAPANGDSYDPEISDNGQILLFRSAATDLVANDFNNAIDAFYMVLGQPEVHLVSESISGESANGSVVTADLSPDGVYVAFSSDATDLTLLSSPHHDVYLRSLEEQRTWLMSRPTGWMDTANQSSGAPSLSQYGERVAFLSGASNLVSDDANAVIDVFVRDVVDDPDTYCSSMTTVDGCVPTIGWVGHPSASVDTGFNIVATNVAPDKPCLLFYGFEGRRALPFLGGTHCVKGATKRSRILHSIPTGPGPCDGLIRFDMNAFAAGNLPGNPQPALSLIGQQVNAQFWGRDPGSPFDVFLTDAIEYEVGP